MATGTNKSVLLKILAGLAMFGLFAGCALTVFGGMAGGMVWRSLGGGWQMKGFAADLHVVSAGLWLLFAPSVLFLFVNSIASGLSAGKLAKRVASGELTQADMVKTGIPEGFSQAQIGVIYLTGVVGVFVILFGLIFGFMR